MRRALTIAATLLVFLTPAAPVDAQGAACQDTETWRACFLRLARLDDATEVVETTKADSKKDAENRLESKATADSLTGSAFSVGDFLSRIATALDVGTLTEEAGSQTLALNLSPSPDGDTSPPQVKLEVVRRDAEPLAALVTALPEAIRSARKTTLESEIGDFDDLEAKLSVALEGKWGGWTFGRSFDLYSAQSTALFEAVAPDPDLAAQQALLALNNTLRQKDPNHSITDPVGDLRAADCALAEELEAAVTAAASSVLENAAAFQSKLREEGYFDLADLINNQPQFYFQGHYRERDERVGQSERGVKLTYEHGFGNINGLRKECGNDLAAHNRVDKTGKQVTCYRYFLNTRRGKMKSANRVAVSAEYVDMDDLRFELPDDDFVFSLDAGSKWIASGVYGRSLIVDDEGHDSSRLDVEAKYEDVSGDPMRQSRLVATATYTQNLFDGNVLSLSIVYANRPEYRGEVDEEFSARAGLKFKIDKKKPKV